MIYFEWAAPVSIALELRAALIEGGSELEPVHKPFEPPADEAEDFAAFAFEPLTIITGTAALGYLIERLIILTSSIRHGGAVVDMRENKVAIHTNPALPIGMVVGITEDGMHVLENADRRGLESLIPNSLGKS